MATEPTIGRAALRKPSSLSSVASQHADRPVERNVVLLTGSQIETTLCFLDGIIRDKLPNVDITRLVLGTVADAHTSEYPKDVVRQVEDFFLAKRPDVVFVTLIEFGLRRLLRLLSQLRGSHRFVCVAGGPYAIEQPQSCIDSGQFDIVNYSHGLESWRIIAHPTDLSAIPNIFHAPNENGKPWVRNGPSRTSFAMEDVPKPYWGLENLYILVNPSWWDKTAPDVTTLCNMGESRGGYPVEHHQWPARHSGVVVLSTGCPINTCDFCSISRMYDQEQILLKEELPTRRRLLRKVSWWSPDKANQILEDYVSKRPNTRYFVFNDNDFASIPTESYAEFLRIYKQRIGLPFYCQSSPHLTIARGATFVQAMMHAGLHTYCMGVESNAATNNSMYDRTGGDQLTFKAIKLFDRYLRSGEVRIALDFINGNAAESRADLLDTIELIRNVPLPWDLAIHNLTLSDKTALAQQIRRQRLWADDGSAAAHVYDIESSDYHHARLKVFQSLKECWLNLVLQWLGGLHNLQMAGCLHRDVEAFFEQLGVAEARMKHKEFDMLVSRKHALESCFDFVVDPDVVEFMQQQPNVVATLYHGLPAIAYGYHESDRYVFDWSTAKVWHRVSSATENNLRTDFIRA